MSWARGIQMTCLSCRSTTRLPIVPTRLLTRIFKTWLWLHAKRCPYLKESTR